MPDNESASLARLLDVAAMRHQALAHNIANLNTPNFKRQKVVFEEYLDQARMQQSILSTTPQVVEEDSRDRIDANSTALEKEMVQLHQNNIDYQTYLRAISFKIKGMEAVIAGRF